MEVWWWYNSTQEHSQWSTHWMDKKQFIRAKNSAVLHHSSGKLSGATGDLSPSPDYAQHNTYLIFE